MSERARRRHAGRPWRQPSRVSRSSSPGELLSFLLFDEVFVEELIAAGRRDAERWLARHPRVWCADPGHDTGFELPSTRAAIEAALLDEYRTLRRR